MSKTKLELIQINLQGTGSFSGSFSGSFDGDGSALTGITAAVPDGTVSSSLQFNDLTDPFTGSFSGSFVGDGSGLTGISGGSSPVIFAGIMHSGFTISANDTGSLKVDGYLSETASVFHHTLGGHVVSASADGLYLFSYNMCGVFGDIRAEGVPFVEETTDGTTWNVVHYSVQSALQDFSGAALRSGMGVAQVPIAVTSGSAYRIRFESRSQDFVLHDSASYLYIQKIT